MTALAQSGLDEAIVDILTRIGFDSVEQFLGAAEVAGPELAACLPQPLNQIISTASRRAMQIPAAKQQELTDLACPLGAKLEAPTRSETVTSAVASLVPASGSNVSLVSNMPPIWDQGDRPTCVAFATLAAYECYLGRNGSHHSLSSQFLYWNCKRNDNIPNEEGTWVATAYSLLNRDGCCVDLDWPYSLQPMPGNEGQGPPPKGVQRRALAYRMTAPTSLPATSVQDIKNALNNGCCVTFSIPVFRSWHQSLYVRQTGEIPNPVPGEIASGGHAMCIVGYSDSQTRPEIGGGRFIIRNSWGGSWGQGSQLGAGYGTIPYLYVARHAMEAYMVGQ